MILNVANSFLLERFDKPGFWSKSKTLKRSQDWFIYSREKHKISVCFFFRKYSKKRCTRYTF